MVEINKVQLIEKIQTGFTAFKGLLAEFDAEQLTQPGVIGNWSIKDILAHILVHEQRMLRWMRERMRGEQPFMYQPYAMPDDELNRLNEEIYHENRECPLGEIRNALEAAHAETLQLVETSNDEELFDSSRYQLMDGEPLWEAIAANTFRHYAEHSHDIRTWQASARSVNR